MNILFSDSNQYFQNTNMLQLGIGFINPMDIDIYVRQSFDVMNSNIHISGGAIQSLNKDHLVDEAFNCYQIQLTNKQPFIVTQGSITFDLENQGFFSANTLKNFIQGMPLIALIILALFTYVAPASVAAILRYISIIGMLVTIFFYGWKITKILYQTLMAKGVNYDGVVVHFEKEGDKTSINDAYIQTLKALKEIHITKVVLYQGELYLKQITKKTSVLDILKNMLTPSKRNSTEAEQQTIQETINFLLTTSFIGNYQTPPNAQAPLQQN